LEIQLEDKGDWKRQLSLTIPADRVEVAMDEAVESYRRKAALPGFRKGKAPTEVIKVRFQGDLEADLMNKLIPDAFDEALREHDLKPIGPPRFHGIRFAVGEPLSFLADFEIWPEIDVQGYRGMALEQEILEVDESMIADALENLRQGRAEFEPVERTSQEGDVIQATLEPVDVKGKPLAGAKPEEIRMEAGSQNLLPEFREVSLGLSAGAEKSIEVKYPEEFQDSQLAGKTRWFRLVVKEIGQKKLPEVDDNFAKSIDSNLDLEGLKAKIRLRLESQELMESKRKLDETIVDRLLDENPFAVPEVMVAYSLEQVITRAKEEKGKVEDEEGLQERFRPVVERMHRRNIFLQNVARQESLSLTDEEIEAELDSMAEDAGVEASVLRRKMEAEGEVERLRDTLQERKILEFLVSSAQVTRIRKPRLTPQEPDQKNRIVTP